ncbi:MAG: hypothetical protein ACP5I3_09960 [Thermoproteus sp.]
MSYDDIYKAFERVVKQMESLRVLMAKQIEEALKHITLYDLLKMTSRKSVEIQPQCYVESYADGSKFVILSNAPIEVADNALYFCWRKVKTTLPPHDYEIKHSPDRGVYSIEFAL